MKTTLPILKGVAFVLLIMLLAFLAGCEKKDIAPYRHLESIIVIPGNDSTYLYWHHDKKYDHLGWQEIPNGNIEKGDPYQFWQEGRTVTMQSAKEMKGVIWLYDGLDKRGEPLEISETNTFTKHQPGPYGSFIIEYEIE